MIKVTSPTSENKARTRFVRWLGRQLRTAGNRLFAAGDLAALYHGWQIVPRYGGLGRLYRDRRFDNLIRCPWCDGAGVFGGAHCGSCGGTGRVDQGCLLCLLHAGGGGAR